MRTRVISVVQLANGSGRTTLATNLAGELARFCHVGLIDCGGLTRDSASWGAVRHSEGFSKHLVVHTASTPAALLERAYRLRDEVDYVVIDGRAEAAMASATAAISGLCLMPVVDGRPWSTVDAATVQVLREARALRRFRVRLVRNFCAPHGGEMHEGGPPRPKVLEATLGARPAYPAALEAGRTAAESRDPLARDEVQALAMQVRMLLRPKTPGEPEPGPSTITKIALNPRSLLHLTS